MSHIAIANQYAKALLEVVSKPDADTAAEAAHAQLKLFVTILKEAPELAEVLASPAVGLPEKARVIARVGQASAIGESVRNFLRVMTHHRRLDLLPEVIARYELLMDQAAGLARAEITSARELNAGERSALEGALARATGLQPRCEYTVEAPLLGGVAVRVGSSVFDGSVRGQLEGLRRRLTSAS